MTTTAKLNEAMAKKETMLPASNGMVELKEWADIGVKAGILPAGTNSYQAMSIIQTGKEIGLQPMQSLRSMSFVKGRLTMSVQLQLALAKQRGVVIKEIIEVAESCTVTLKRNDEIVTCKYTLNDARKAGLLREGGSYEKYERQMLRWRAIGDALRLIAPDLVMGLLSPEEANGDALPETPIIGTAKEADIDNITDLSSTKTHWKENVPDFTPPPTTAELMDAAPPIIEADIEETEKVDSEGVVTGLIETFTKKEGKDGKGKPYTKYDMTVKGIRLSSFSDTVAKEADEAISGGFDVGVEYTVKGKYNNISRLYIIGTKIRDWQKEIEEAPDSTMLDEIWAEFEESRPNGPMIVKMRRVRDSKISEWKRG